MYRIALLTYPFVLPYFEEITENFHDQCDIEVIPFEKQGQLLEMIPSLTERYDGLCVFSALVDRFLRQTLPDLKKPVAYLDGHSVDFFKTFFLMLNKNRAVDFSRVFIDTTMLHPQNVRTLDYLLDNLPVFEAKRSNYAKDMTMEDFLTMESKIGQNALTLWAEKRFDLIICRYASVASLMEKENIPFLFIYPEKHRILESLENLLNRIRLEKQMEGLPASVMIFTGMETQREFHEISHDSIRIQKALLEFSKNYASNFLIQFMPQGYEILTSHLTVEKITENFVCCQLGYFLFSTLGISACIGYGVGHDISSSRQNAFTAGKAAMEAGMSCVVTESGQTIPLQARPSAPEFSVQADTSSYLSNKTGLSPVTLQRISSALRFLGTNDITNHDLAEALQVTVANTNRFINALIKSGNAEVVETRKSTSKGRPSRIYRIQL